MKPHMLPDIRQTVSHDCGVAAWKTIYRWHTDKRPGAILDLSNGIQGLDPATLESKIRVGKSWNVVAGEMMTDDLRHYCDSYRPVICLITRDFDGEECGHYVVVSGVYRRRVYYQDPYDGPRSLPATEWNAGWHDRGRYADFTRWGLVAWPKG
jgi:ABC-type bacteriocin/lantibiotic exporter with double-glycine peptidase domain